MRKLLMIAMTIAIALMPLTGEAKKKKADPKQEPANPFGQLFQIPNSEVDTEEYFGATGIAYGPLNQLGEVQKNALENGQDQIRMKMKHSYQGMISNYSKTSSNKLGTDIQSKLEGAGDHIINAIVNDTRDSKEPIYTPDDKGNVTVFRALRVYKKEFADRVSKYISEDEELKLQFDEKQFRERMDEAFKKYKEDNQ